MLFIIAWRNVWRNWVRSLIVILAFTFGLMGALFIASMSNGMVERWIQTTIDNEIGEVRIQDSTFMATNEMQYAFSLTPIQKVLDDTKSIRSYSPFLSQEVIGSAADKTTFLTLKGIDPMLEKKVTNISNYMIEGDYFEDSAAYHPVLLSSKTAKDLNVKLGQYVAFSIITKEGLSQNEGFKVVGIFNTKNDMIDKRYAFVLRKDLQSAAGLGSDMINDVSIRIDKPDLHTEQVVSALESQLPEKQIKTWDQISPELKISKTSTQAFSYILVMIILIALVFGIINTMLMVILERTKEIGMLRALGMNKRKIGTMIVLETLLLGLVGGITGNFISYSVINYLGKTGINLAELGDFKEGLETFGLGTMLYPDLELSFYTTVTIMVIITSLIASIFPIRKALKLDPATAVRD